MNNRTIKGFPMKNLINTITLIFIVLFSFSGCDGKANFEDKELTKFFIKNNKDKLNKIHHIKTFSQYGLFSRNEELVTNVYLSLFGGPYFDYGFKDCNYAMRIDSDSLKFAADDIANYGKEAMYKEAEKCLNAVIKEIEKTEKEVKKKEIDKQIQAKDYDYKLNKKFDESRIIDDK